VATKKRPPRLPCSQQPSSQQPGIKQRERPPTCPAGTGYICASGDGCGDTPQKGPRPPRCPAGSKPSFQAWPSLWPCGQFNGGGLAPAIRSPAFLGYMFGKKKNGQQPPSPHPSKQSFPIGLKAVALRSEKPILWGPVRAGCWCVRPPLSRFSPRFGLRPEKDRRGGRMRPRAVGARHSATSRIGGGSGSNPPPPPKETIQFPRESGEWSG